MPDFPTTSGDDMNPTNRLSPTTAELARLREIERLARWVVGSADLTEPRQTRTTVESDFLAELMEALEENKDA